MRVSDGADSSGTLPEASDAAHLQRYVEMAQTEAGFRRYLEDIILESPTDV